MTESASPGIGPIPDGDLIIRWVSARDNGAFETLVRRHAELMRRTAAVALGTAARRDPGMVDDAIQEARRRLMSALPAFRGDCSAAAFMAAVARRVSLDQLRAMLRHKARGERAVRLAIAAAPEAGDPGAGLERAEAARAVMELLSRLPEPDRSLLYLRDAEGLDVASLAASFKLPEGTVKSKLARARKRIRDKALAAWGNA